MTSLTAYTVLTLLPCCCFCSDGVDVAPLLTDMFDKLARYANGEIAASAEDYALLEKLNLHAAKKVERGTAEQRSAQPSSTVSTPRFLLTLLLIASPLSLFSFSSTVRESGRSCDQARVGADDRECDACQPRTLLPAD